MGNGLTYRVSFQNLELQVEDRDNNGRFDLIGNESERDVVYQPVAIGADTGVEDNAVRQLYEIVWRDPGSLDGLSIQGVFGVITRLDVAYARKGLSDFDAQKELAEIAAEAQSAGVADALSLLFVSAREYLVTDPPP